MKVFNMSTDPKEDLFDRMERELDSWFQSIPFTPT